VQQIKTHVLEAILPAMTPESALPILVAVMAAILLQLIVLIVLPVPTVA
jgi:hypothetical protein